MVHRSTLFGSAIVLFGVLSASAAAADEEVELLPSLPSPAVAPTPQTPLPAPPRTESPSGEEAPVASSPPHATRFSLRPCLDGRGGCETDGAPSTQGRWYGYQTLIVDGASVLLGLSSVSLGAAGGIASAGTYVFGAPIVHLAHGNGGMFAASLGTRVVSPVIGGATGYLAAKAVDPCRGGGDFVCGAPIAGVLIGVVSGFLAASALDAALYSKVPKEKKEPKEEAKRWDGQPRVLPTVSASPNGASVGFGGTF